MPNQPSLPVALFLALRPKQWIKNALVLAGLVFTANQHHGVGDIARALAAVLVFCALSSCIYLINDICDVEQDRHHPRKRKRPIAAGWVKISQAWSMSAVLGAAGVGAAFCLGLPFALTALTYLALTVAYSFRLKHEVLIDVLALAGCYVLRAVAGAVVLSVEISPWLLVCTTLGALLVGLAKRRNELVTLTDAGSHRRILMEYTVPMLDQMIGIVAAATLMAYMLYTFSSPTAQHRPLLMVTIPYVIYGIFRFLYLMHRHGKGGDPSAELVEDRGLLVCGLLWGITSAVVVLWGR